MTNLGEIKGKPIAKNLQYKSVLQKEVPWCGMTVKHPDFDEDLCWWCQADLRIKVTPDVVVWCKRCYTLHYKNHDGTYMQQEAFGLGKDWMDVSQGKVKPKYMTVDKDTGKVVIED